MMVAVVPQWRDHGSAGHAACVAERSLTGDRWFQASLRDANGPGGRGPWLESHGYHHPVAP